MGRRVWGSLLALGLVGGLLVGGSPHAQSVSTFTVTNTNDTGAGSLRQAILDANTTANSGGPDVIAFAIPPAGSTATIVLASALPAIDDPVVVDGLTQGCGDRLTSDPDPCIEIDGDGGEFDGLTLAAGSDGSTLQGLAVTNFGDLDGFVFQDGVVLSSSDNTVEDSFLGVALDGSTAKGSSFVGLEIDGGDSNTIQNNVVSGNGFNGIFLTGDAGTNDLSGNLIGTAANGTDPLPNVNFDGIDIDSGDGNEVLQNTIAFNGTGSNEFGVDGDGVDVGEESTGNKIAKNSIHSNETLGIDLNTDELAEDEVTHNDGDDSDTGANDFQNFPELTSAERGASTDIAGTLDSTADSTFDIEFFSSPFCDSLGFGEGQTFLGETSVSTGPSGHADFNVQVTDAPDGHSVVTATATNVSESTSEFSACRTLGGSSSSPPTEGPNLVATKTDFVDPVFPGGAVQYSVTVKNAGGANATGVVVTDPLPSPLESEGGVLEAVDGRSTDCEETQPVTCEVGTISPGEERRVTISATVPDDASPGTVTNTVTVSSEELADVQAAEETTIGAGCDGKKATHIGTEDGETITGSAHNDVIVALGGNDTVVGGGGNDTICGGPGDDTIHGNEENDRIFGNEGADTLLGDLGNDFLNGGKGDDPLLNGGAGDDEIHGGPGDDQAPDQGFLISIRPGLAGGPGDDELFGDNGSDILNGGEGKSDKLRGGSGSDVASGGPGPDDIAGGQGDWTDLLLGNTGNDKIYGDGGHDILNGGHGRDRLDGGLGNDLIHGSGGPDRLFGDLGKDKLLGDEGGDLLYGDQSDVRDPEADVIPGENDVLNGGKGSDFLRGGGGADDLAGGEGKDWLISSLPNGAVDNASDSLHGGSEADLCLTNEEDTATDCEWDDLQQVPV